MSNRKIFAFRISIDRRFFFQHVQNIKLKKMKIYHYTVTITSSEIHRFSKNAQ